MHIALISPRKKRKNFKTHANSIESLIISNMFLKTHANSMLLEKITFKPMRIATKMKRRNQPPEPEDISAGFSPALEIPSRSFARTHARHEHETKPKPISRLGSAVASFPTTSDIYRYDHSSSDKEIVGRGAGERPAVEKMC
jgi:hypothetical protein